MREIEFRGYCERDSEWRFGSYSTDGVTHEILTLMKAGALYASQVPLESIGQYTGLKDKDGVKIFEGDIMQWHGDESTVAVKWEQATCSYTAFGRLCAMHLKPDEDGDGHLLVIGNIYETPERLHATAGTE